MILLKAVEKEQSLEKCDKYLQNSVYSPFFVLVDEEISYRFLCEKLSFSAKTILASDFCQPDSFPDFDQIINLLKTSTEPILLLGLGEALHFYGNSSVLGQFKDLFLNTKVIIPLRGIQQEVLVMQQLDAKFDARRLCLVQGDGIFQVTQYSSVLGVSVDADGFQKFLALIEVNPKERLSLISDLPLCFTEKIERVYDMILERERGFCVPEEILSDELWAKYLENPNETANNIRDWRAYINEYQKPSCAYMKLVVEKSNSLQEYQENIITAIIGISHKAPEFLSLYKERKEILKTLDEQDIVPHLSKIKVKDNDERIYYLTDCTTQEKYDILNLMKHYSPYPKNIALIYPDLQYYLTEYHFNCKNAEIFTEYFNKYKKLKVSNLEDEQFVADVSNMALAGHRPFLGLETRGSIVEKLDCIGTKLYWVDALGVEYLGYIQKILEDWDLSAVITIGKAELPTLTSSNRDFYDQWKNEKVDTKKLDNVKHNKGREKYTGNSSNYLVEELQIIHEILLQIRLDLTNKTYNKIVLASDHGASRLSVIYGQESKWEMKEKGNHSGRCCPASDFDTIPDCATEGFVTIGKIKRKFWVLANYDRFKGGRKAEVEVHGGASLEEVLVPTIQISLKENSLKFENCTPANRKVQLGKPQYLILFCETIVENLSFYFQGKEYFSVKEDKNPLKHRVDLPKELKPGFYQGEVFVNGKQQHPVEFEIKSAVTNGDDDFFS